VVDETGQIMKEAGAASAPEARDALLSNLGLPRELIGLEACALTAWLDGESKATGWPAICIELRHAKAAMGAMPNKTDRNSF
jgi:transposase